MNAKPVLQTLTLTLLLASVASAMAQMSPPWKDKLKEHRQGEPGGPWPEARVDVSEGSLVHEYYEEGEFKIEEVKEHVEDFVRLPESDQEEYTKESWKIIHAHYPATPQAR